METENQDVGQILADQFFSNKEKQQLEKIQDLRFMLIDKLTRGEDGEVKIPGPTSEKLLLVDLMNNADKSNKDRAKLRIASKATEVAGINSQEIAEVLRRHRVATQTPATQEERELPASIKPDDIVPGEMSIGVENISIHEILKN